MISVSFSYHHRQALEVSPTVGACLRKPALKQVLVRTENESDMNFWYMIEVSMSDNHSKPVGG